MDVPPSNPNEEFARALLADVETFQVKMQAAQDALAKSAQAAFDKFLDGNEEMKRALAQPAQGF